MLLRNMPSILRVGGKSRQERNLRTRGKRLGAHVGVQTMFPHGTWSEDPRSAGAWISFPRFRFLFLSLFLFLLHSAYATLPVYGQLKAVSEIEREEKSTTTNFAPYRERSTQRVLYVHTTPFLTNEFDFRHVSYEPFSGAKSQANQLWQASFSGRNLTAPMEFKAGRIWDGLDRFRPIDGGSWNYRWGHRLSTNLIVGQFSRVADTWKNDRPRVFEGSLRYAFNEQTFLNVGGAQDYKDPHSLVQLGYHIDSLRLLGEHRNEGATDTWRMSLQYNHPSKVDLLGDYRVDIKDGKAGGTGRALVAYDAGRCYVEGGLGKVFRPDEARSDNRTYYEGSLKWGKPDLGFDGMTLSYRLEHGIASTARIIGGEVERKVSDKTRIILGLSNTRIDEGGDSLQNLEGRLHRKVEWGYYEVSAGFITGLTDVSMQKDVAIRAGLEF
ncbi:MAG: hypothetical protein WA705_31720 [Candidatus Ozemobacteraceae bacterium]